MPKINLSRGKVCSAHNFRGFGPRSVGTIALGSVARLSIMVGGSCQEVGKNTQRRKPVNNDQKPPATPYLLKVQSQALLAHPCNPSYSGGRDQEDHGSKPAWGNSSRPYFEKTHHTKWMAKGLKV
jgi:hypothetical protein